MSGDWLETSETYCKTKRPKFRSKTSPFKVTEEPQTIVFCSEPVAVFGHGESGKRGFRFRKCPGEATCQKCLECKAEARAAGDDDWREATDRELRLYILLMCDGKEYYKDFIADKHFPFFKEHAPVSRLRVVIRKNGPYIQSRTVMEKKGREEVECRDAEPFIMSHRFCLPPDLLTPAQMEKAINDLATYGETSYAPLKRKREASKPKAPATNGAHKNGHLAGATS